MKDNTHAKIRTHFVGSAVIALVASVLAFSLLFVGRAANTVSTTIKGSPDRDLLETTHEACGKDKLVFDTGWKKVTIPYGQSASFANHIYPLVWYCGASEKEHTRCPPKQIL